MPSRAGLSVVREAPRSLSERAAVVSNQDDVVGTLLQAKKYLQRQDTTAALECVDQALKLVEVEFAALMAEAHELSGLLVRATTESEQARIAASQPDVSWSFRETNWRGEDYLAGPAE